MRYVISKIGTAILAVVTLLGIGAYSLFPRIGIDPYASSDPKNPFASQFAVQNNNSIYSLHDVQGVCHIFDVSASATSGASNLTVSAKGMDKIDELEPDAKMNVVCRFDQAFKLGESYTKLDVGITVTYRLPLGFHGCKSSKFSGVPTAESTFIWTYQGSAKCEWHPDPSN